MSRCVDTNSYVKFQCMLLMKMINFCKGADCPTSHDVLAFQRDALPVEAKKKIDLHISRCDFCEAEAEIYLHYPVGEENAPAAEIPLPLFELAESLLSNRAKGNHLLKKLLIENEGLTLTEA